MRGERSAETTRLPGLRRQRELRYWSIADVARASGLSWPTAAQADAGEEVSLATARKILAALEASPPSETALRLMGMANGTV
jgi:hypothetical protein